MVKQRTVDSGQKETPVYILVNCSDEDAKIMKKNSPEKRKKWAERNANTKMLKVNFPKNHSSSKKLSNIFQISLKCALINNESYTRFNRLEFLWATMREKKNNKKI